jgi:CheY-like chemotaxis protein
MGGESKIIVLTADAIRGSRETLLAKGFDEYLGKPINLKQLERVFTLFLPENKLTITSPAPSLEAEPDSRRADSEEIRYLKENLPKLDITMGLNNCGGSLSDYLNVLKINYTHGERQLADLEKMLQEKDYENYTIKVHSLKSTTLGIGAVNISNLALEQEKAGKNGEYDYIDSHFEALKADYSSLLIQLQQVLSHYGLLAEAPAQNGEPLDSQAFINILTDIRTQVDNFDFSTVFDILEETKKLALSPAHSEVFKQLDSLMENLEVDEVRSLIDKTITQPA